MAFEITQSEEYVCIEFLDGLDYWKIFEAAGKPMLLPDAEHKNDLHIFRNGRLSFTYNDQYKIKEVIENNYPSDAAGTKSAIVIGNGV